ncbi:PP2C family serine/threonine-protein phosphatase [Ralstonia solanacearum]|uniref:PP2C family serine/threonine-protein phosphatase n=1 Tax=Ralstonia solanacearum TaxID=305 RepID=UPI000E66EA44|nr:PP2C family serine/threonine-protein phosphatase [Ralstonia solanacearum]MDB0566245.1 protein phosphatase 2C domain-containing protein [Ralstonia solanacearum]MDB0576072.1 protein phosphatase 2C domain-containing protein [Ralstonia solanacearum]QOK84566.1 protein phosphatase 2C domain-containing protein [Ralstonia solanacearum]RIJ85188.1 protein phosphatase 2C domain-containing protein [Ralstonia solanacearum]
MSWLTVSASIAGTSHVATGLPCQDSCYANVERDARGEPVLVVLVADGAGSAEHGGLGAERAIEYGVSAICQQLQQREYCLHEEFATNCVIAVRERLYAAAESEGNVARDYACTFLGLVSSANRTLLMQVGDGGIVVDTGVGLQLPIQPMTGEYANQTYFVTDMDALDYLAIKIVDAGVKHAAAFSDGIQRLALHLQDGEPHAPFFAPFFATLDKISEEQVADLEVPLRAFLDSASVNERTDDDKTLVLVASRL